MRVWGDDTATSVNKYLENLGMDRLADGEDLACIAYERVRKVGPRCMQGSSSGVTLLTREAPNVPRTEGRRSQTVHCS